MEIQKGGFASLGLATLFWCACVAAVAGTEPARVVILANSQIPESIELANLYAATREIPSSNIIVLPLPVQETISWDEYISLVLEPLRDQLIEDGWMLGLMGQGTDPYGRRPWTSAGHRISFLVLCKGVPLRIAHDPARLPQTVADRFPAQFRTNQGSVDGELSLIAMRNEEINALLRNPLFQNRRPGPSELDAVVRVARLDGPSFDGIRHLILDPPRVEANGLIGRAYVDKGGPHQRGDEWLDQVQRWLRNQYFSLQVEETRQTFSPTVRMDAPAWYFGWYARHVNGPFALPGFRFAPGAIAWHIHSFSASTLRSPETDWSGPLIQAGAAVTVGNVYEPFLEFSHHPHLFVEALSFGWTIGEAAYYALPALSWQAILIGDPLYRPLAVGLTSQWGQIHRIHPRWQPYVALRRFQQLEAADSGTDWLPWLRMQFNRMPSLPLALKVARRHQDNGEIDSIVASLRFARHLQWTSFQDVPLGWELARIFHEIGETGTALEIVENILQARNLPNALREESLVLAMELASASGKMNLLRKWGDALQQLRSSAGNS